MSKENEWESTKGEGTTWSPMKEENGDPRTEATADDILDGYYVDVKHNVGQNSQTLYSIKNKETGEISKVWGTKALVDEMEKVRLGTYIRIQWLGKKLTKAGALVPAKQRTSLHSFHAWEVFQNKNVPALDLSHIGSQGSPQAMSSGPANESKSSGGTGIKKATVIDDSSDLPFRHRMTNLIVF
jgi:hypothetical protein